VTGLERFLDSVWAGLTLAAPVLIAAAAGYALHWLRLQRARLRAARLKLPPSSEPPRPSWWQSIRPKRYRRRRAPLELDSPIELEPRSADAEANEASARAELERRAGRMPPAAVVDDVAGLDDDDERTPPRGRPRPPSTPKFKRR
jgi:hypothetical protein